MKIVGQWLHTHGDSGELNWQRKIVGKEGDALRVQLFSWLTGDRTRRVRMTRDEINAATRYSDETEWLAASERGFGLIVNEGLVQLRAYVR